jgi:tetrahydromethanopterin S-methyltransferase subunit G
MDTDTMTAADDITKELIDYEPTNAAAYAGNNGSPDEAPVGRSGRREHGSSEPAGDVPEQLRRTSRSIGDTLADISAGRTVGKYPGVERIIGPGRSGSRRPIPAGARYDRQKRSKYGPHEGAASAASRGYITDVRPPVKERLAIVEHRLDDVQDKVGDAYALALQATPAGEMHDALRAIAAEANRRIDSVHKRLDREVVPDIKELQGKRIIRDWALGVSLAVTIVYSIVLTVKHLL